MSDRKETSPADDLRRTVSDALDLIDHEAGSLRHGAAPALPAGALLDQCRALVERARDRRPEPVRLVHHMACTGGTVISKLIAALPNTILISEVDPLSDLHLKSPKKPFFPTDLIADLRYSPRDISRNVDIAVFTAGLSALRGELEREGRRLVLRDHSHSRYHATPEPEARPGLRDIAARVGDTLSVITVRHPLDSYISLQHNGWVQFEPATLDEYCRRYRLFLEDHAGLPIYKYEAFTEDPDGVMQQIAADLQLGWTDDAAELYSIFRHSGDSGRKSFRIGPRARRDVPETLAEEAARSAHFETLCAQLGYE